MFAQITVRTKILTLIAIAVLALLMVMAIAFQGLKKESEMLAEIGKNRMPSVKALMAINEGKTGIRSANRAAEVVAAYPEDTAEIAQQIKRRTEIFAEIDSAWKIYEPLPQSTDEAALWKTFVKQWDAWRLKDAEFGGLLSQIRGADLARRKELFLELHRNQADNRPVFREVEASLDKLVELNVKYGDDSVQEADAASSSALTSMYVASGVALALLVAIGLLILSGIMRQLGGDPGYAARIVRQVADGDLSADVELKSGDSTSLLAA
ncbi:MAG: Tar ligand binding domain-containing protein, partial [Pseudomonadota bacterium]